MARKPEKPVYSFVRRGNYLVPELEYDCNALTGIAQGQRVRVDIKEWRNLDRLKAYWAMLHEVVAATGANSLTAERLHEVAKLENGCVDLIMLPSGLPVAIPASIALDKMSEPEFVAFFEKVKEWLARTYGFTPSADGADHAEAGNPTKERTGELTKTLKAGHGVQSPASAKFQRAGGF